MYFTKFIPKPKHGEISLETLAGYSYLLVIFISGEYDEIPKDRLSKLCLHLDRLNDYLAVIIKGSELGEENKIIQSFVSDFEVDPGQSFIGVVLIDNIDKKTWNLKIVKTDLPDQFAEGSSPGDELWRHLKKTIDVSVPLADKKGILSKLTLDRLLKVLGIAI